MDRALRIVPHANSRVTLLAQGQFSAQRALVCFEISLTALYLSPVLDAQRREGPELDDTIPKKKERLLFLVYKHSLKESYYKKHFLVISFVETMLIKVVLISSKRFKT